MVSIGDERKSVQNPMIGYAEDVGWIYLNEKESSRLRGGKEGITFKELFINMIQNLNPDFMDHHLAEELLKRLERVKPNIEGNFIIWEHIKGLKTVYVPGEKRERNVRFIDDENIDRNTFHVTDEFIFTNGSKTIKPDVVFLINGIPLFFVETKSAEKIDGITEAIVQVKKYHRHCPELMAVLQVYAMTHIIRYFYSATWNTSEKLLYNWRDETAGDYETLVKKFIDRNRVIKVLKDYILFTRQDDELKKIILRPHQMRVINKLVDRASEDKKRALVWHTQGSGKTYTMIVAAEKILENPIFENPTVIMLVDRNELESQLFGNLKAVGINELEIAGNKKKLRRFLKEDRRGLLVSMIHKFDKMPAKINERDNIFILVDEAHRTTEGKLGSYLMAALPNATYIGFTGTPIDKTSHGKGTFVIFGKDDPPHGYIDKYSISESIEDGTTVPLHYSLAPNELRVDRETLEEEFLGLADAEGVSDIDKLNKILEKAVTLRNMLKNKERVCKVAEHVVNHYKSYIEPMGYKAFFVAVDREACALYKEEFDKYFPEDYCKVVYSPYYNDEEELEKYHLTEIEEKRIRKNFRNPEEEPKILIVTEKLLTGFDAPILYCMYLDKPMRDHVLLQAIARVNRPYEDDKGRRKPSGFVLDFIGIFDNLEKALAFDSHDVAGVINDIEVLKLKFISLIETARSEYLVIIEEKYGDKAVEAVLTHFMDEELRQEYYKFFREISDIYEIISPDKFLRSYIEDFETLARMYKILKSAFDYIEVPQEFLRKTAELVQKHSKSSKIEDSLEIYEINDDILKKIEKSNEPDVKKVFNLIKSIKKHVEKGSDSSPYLTPIGEKAELIAQMYKKRQITSQETLEEIKKIIDEINTAKKEENSKNMSNEGFSIFWMMKKSQIDEPETKAHEMELILEKYPHWRESESHEREVKKKLIGILLNSGMKNVHSVTKKAQNIIRVIKGEGNDEGS